MSYIRIRPCRCGAAVRVKKDRLWDGSHGYPGCYTYYIKCDKCGCTIDFQKNDTVYRSKEEAVKNVINQWNGVYKTAKSSEIKIHRLCKSCVHKEICIKLQNEEMSTGCKEVITKDYIIYPDCKYGSYFYVVNDKIREHCCCGFGKDGTPIDENGQNYSEDEYTLTFDFAVKKWAELNKKTEVDIPFLFANGYVESVRWDENGKRAVERSD